MKTGFFILPIAEKVLLENKIFIVYIMSCGNLNFSCGYNKNKSTGISTLTIGRLAYLNKYSKPSPTRNYSSDDARARAIRRRVMGKINVNNSARNGPLFGLKKNRCPNYCDKKGMDCGANSVYNANNGSSSDFTYFKKIAGGPIKLNTCIDWKGC